MPVPGLNEALLASIANAVLGHVTKQGAQLALPEDRLRRWLGRDRQQLAFRTALAHAFAAFSDRYPDWAASLFDLAFLEKRAAPLLARCLTPDGCPAAEELAAVWAAQLAPEGPARERWIVEATVAAGEFIRMLEAELRHREEFRPLYDSRALDDLVESAAENAYQLAELRHDLSQALDDANEKYQVALSHSLGVLIGDHGQQTNVFNIYSQAATPLGEKIRSQEFEPLVEERTRSFVGRDFVFRAIDDLLLNSQFGSGYIVIRGEPGIGKTAVLAELVRRRGYVHHFNIAAQNIRSVRDFLANVCAQLIVRYGLTHRYLPPEATQDSGFMTRLLAEAVNSGAGRVVVLVDALDEAEDLTALPTAANRLLLPTALPPNVYFVVTTREQVDYHLLVDRREDIYLNDQDPRNSEDIREYVRTFIRNRLTEMSSRIAEWGVDESEFIAVMADRSQGNFMYLVHVLRDIEAGKLTARTIDDIRQLPQGLRDYYRKHWRRMEIQDRQSFDRKYRPVVCMLAAAQEPVTVEQLSGWTRLSGFVIKQVIEEWRPFLNQDDNEFGHPRYHLYHLSFQEFLNEEVGLREQHSMIADIALGKISGFDEGPGPSPTVEGRN